LIGIGVSVIQPVRIGADFAVWSAASLLIDLPQWRHRRLSPGLCLAQTLI
jgi:hypothetical protein